MRELLAALGAGEGSTRYVGGCVRDTLMGLEAADVDLATRLSPQEVTDRLAAARIKAVPTGIAHGTVTAIVSGRPVEITTLRRDVSTDGRRATIAYTDDWREDAARRDFTINALSADPATLHVHDYFGGGEDLAARRVRFIGQPLTRIAEDHLRILRFFRFHARFGAGEPDAEALEACVERANDLMALSRERIADELSKLLSLPRPEATVALMVEHGVLAPVLPEIDVTGGDRLARLVDREAAAGIETDWLRRFAALLPADPEIAANIASRLRLSKRAAKRLTAAAGREPGDAAAPRALAYGNGREAAIDRLLLGEGEPGEAAALADWERPRLRLSGGNLIDMGLPAGPIVARTLQAIEKEWVEADFPPDPAAQRALARRHVDQALKASQ
ncbi:MAG TPA: CCA tRNA nucleotidyltransferase [Allosphingosinicella sp.]|nr:CCA tRNA nucleotidyltransferase [Allosphingosinicella sp.]